MRARSLRDADVSLAHAEVTSVQDALAQLPARAPFLGMRHALEKAQGHLEQARETWPDEPPAAPAAPKELLKQVISALEHPSEVLRELALIVLRELPAGDRWDLLISIAREERDREAEAEGKVCVGSGLMSTATREALRALSASWSDAGDRAASLPPSPGGAP